MAGKAQPHEMAATLAWFAPPRVGSLNYRGARLRIIEPTDAAGTFGVSPAKEQPDVNQAHSGTVIHRRWSGARAAAIGNDSVLELMVQRQPDDSDDLMPFGLIITLAMPGVQDVYTQVRNRVAIKPKVPIAP
jgi:hypothetical protein